MLFFSRFLRGCLFFYADYWPDSGFSRPNADRTAHKSRSSTKKWLISAIMQLKAANYLFDASEQLYYCGFEQDLRQYLSFSLSFGEE